MSFVERVNRATIELSADKHTVEQAFDIIENEGRGNCMFYSFSQLLTNSDSQKKHTEIRKQVCEFYKSFDLNESYAPGSVEDKLQFLLQFAVEPEHRKNICRGGRSPEWGTNADILAVIAIYKVNVVVFALYRHNPSEYQITPYHFFPDGTRTFYLRYNTLNQDEEHYEAMRPRISFIPEEPPIFEPSTTTTTTKSKTATKKKTVEKKTTDDPHSFIGMSVAKKFEVEHGSGEDYFMGTVVEFKKPYYTIRYEDGDTEEVTKRELDKIILKGGRKSPTKKRTQRHTKRTQRHRKRSQRHRKH